MTRVFLTVILPLLLPTALYVLWSVGAGRAQAVASNDPWRALPWPWLAAAGAVLAALVLGMLVEIGGTRDGVYVAPHLEDGKIVPGHVESAPKE